MQLGEGGNRQSQDHDISIRIIVPHRAILQARVAPVKASIGRGRVASPLAGEAGHEVAGGVDLGVGRRGSGQLKKVAKRLPAFTGFIDEQPLPRHGAADVPVVRG